MKTFEQRVYELSASEAKTALINIIEEAADSVATPFENEVMYYQEMEYQKNRMLDSALKQ